MNLNLVVSLFSNCRNLHEQGSSQSSHAEDKKKHHIKKPLNAFMLFMKEQRAKVVAECTLKESAAINQILGRKVWILYGTREITHVIIIFIHGDLLLRIEVLYLSICVQVK